MSILRRGNVFGTDKAVNSKGYSNSAIHFGNLGDTLIAKGDIKGVKAYYECMLKEGEALYGKNHPKVAIFINNLGKILYDTGDLEGAKKTF